MTNAELIAKIKAEIERQYDEYKAQYSRTGNPYHLGIMDGLDMAEQSIPSAKEESIPSNLEEAAKSIARDVCKQLPNGEEKDGIVYYAILAAIAGAKWQKEQMLKEAMEGEVDFEYFGYKVIKPDLKQLDTLLESMNHGDKVRIIIVKE